MEGRLQSTFTSDISSPGQTPKCEVHIFSMWWTRGSMVTSARQSPLLLPSSTLSDGEFKVARTAQRPFKTIDAHYTSPPLSQQANPKSVDINFDFSKWVYLFIIEAINNIALSSFLGLLEKETDIVTAQQPDGTLYPARYCEAQSHIAICQAVFIWDYKHYLALTRLSKLVHK
ncbi:hypothetical protein AnigIFM50267_011215 [Aspergillus niger]|nr:hypothetical protein AnigIFM50267_011215 [Aspergillus niger]